MYVRTVLCVCLVAGALVPVAQATTLSQSERRLLSVVNDVRATHNLRPLVVDRKLLAAARAYSATLIREDVFTHGAFAERLANSGARGPTFGENLAWGVGPPANARHIVRMWLESPSHRANLLRPGWTRVGIGTRVGRFLGLRGATVVTADFAGS